MKKLSDETITAQEKMIAEEQAHADKQDKMIQALTERLNQLEQTADKHN